MHPLMSLMPLPHQSLGFLHSIPSLIVLNCSFIPGSNFMSYNARLGLYFCMFHFQTELFYSYPAAFGFYTATLSNNIVLSTSMRGNKVNIGFCLFKSGLHGTLVVHLWQRNLTLKLNSGQWKSLISNRLVLDIVESHHLIRFHIPVFHYYNQFKIKAALAHWVVI